MKKLKEKGKYDVVVVGGGIAGVSASVSAARNGVKVCLIEKSCCLGGLATLGLVNVYIPFCDGKGNQIIKGIAEELIRVCGGDGNAKIPDYWLSENKKEQRKTTRYFAEVNPFYSIIALEEFVLKEGIEIKYDTIVYDVIKKEDRITDIIVLDKEGTGKISCSTVIDATGDADICYFAGEETVSVDKNVPCGWFFYYDGKNLKKYTFTEHFDRYNQDIPEGIKTFSGVKASDITEQVLESRRKIKELFFKIKEGKTDAYLLSIPVIPTFRMTRRLKGKFELREEDEGKIFPDAVGITGDWRKPGPLYYIPFSCLYGVKTKNLITAGRCISASTAWDIIRVIPTCALTGEISGTASAILVKEKIESFSSIEIKKLQKVLKKQGVIF
ncbi:MAG TPA: FAD-dependent oxidoreductase [bacterium]|nr:FAD-dependent oxidoreductase [bacterium]HOM26085.1 FAD-dependent oxidoreductase [bacterium]